MPSPAPESVHIAKAFDLGRAAAHELVYLDRHLCRPVRIVVGTDLFNAVYGFIDYMAMRSPDNDHDRIVTGGPASLAAHARFLRCAGEHFLALAEIFEPHRPAERVAAQAELQVLAQTEPASHPCGFSPDAQPDLLAARAEHPSGREVDLSQKVRS